MAIDWTPIYHKYCGLWVALKDDEHTVIAAADTVKKVMYEAKEKGCADPILMRVPTKIIPYVGAWV